MNTTTITLQDRITSSYHYLLDSSGDLVSLTDIRDFLGDVPRAEVDATLIRMDATPAVTIMPEANRKTLTAEDHAAAVIIGGEPNHLIHIKL